MSPRKNRPKPARATGRRAGGDDEPGERYGFQSAESWRGEQWSVRHVSGSGPASAAGKRYRCPGCDQEIVPGTPHIVAWPADGTRMAGGVGVEERRHWHTTCWQNRLRRSPGVRRRPRP